MKIKYILSTLFFCLLLLGFFVHKNFSFSPHISFHRKNNSLHKYCDYSLIRDLHLKYSYKDKSMQKVSFQRLDPYLKGVSAQLLSLRAKWKFLDPPLGEANPRYLEHIISSLCFIPRQKTLSKKERKILESKNYNIQLRMKQVQYSKTRAETKTRKDFLTFSLGDTLANKRIAMKVQKKDSKVFFISIPNKIKKLLEVPIKNFQNHRVLYMRRSAIEFLRVFVDNKERFFLERNSPMWILGKKNTRLGSSFLEAEKFVNRIANLQAIHIKDTKLSKKDCLEKKPYIKILFEGIRGRKEELRFVKEKEAIEVCSTKRSSLFQVHKSILPYLLINPEKLQKTSPL